MSPDAERVHAAVQALAAPGRLAEAEGVVARAAPDLQMLLAQALSEGGWFDSAHGAAIKEALAAGTLEEQIVAVRTLCAEETRLAMLVGATVGFELARELRYDETPPAEET